jgi:hypothetical protein
MAYFAWFRLEIVRTETLKGGQESAIKGYRISAGLKNVYSNV